MAIVPASRSTSRQRSASSSPRRMPVMASTCHAACSGRARGRPGQERGQLGAVHGCISGGRRLLGGRRDRLAPPGCGPAAAARRPRPRRSAAPMIVWMYRTVRALDRPVRSPLPSRRPDFSRSPVQRRQPGRGQLGQRHRAEVRARRAAGRSCGRLATVLGASRSPSSQAGQVRAERHLAGLGVRRPWRWPTAPRASPSSAAFLVRNPRRLTSLAGAVRPGDDALVAPPLAGAGSCSRTRRPRRGCAALVVLACHRDRLPCPGWPGWRSHSSTCARSRRWASSSSPRRRCASRNPAPARLRCGTCASKALARGGPATRFTAASAAVSVIISLSSPPVFRSCLQRTTE